MSLTDLPVDVLKIIQMYRDQMDLKQKMRKLNLEFNLWRSDRQCGSCNCMYGWCNNNCRYLLLSQRSHYISAKQHFIHPLYARLHEPEHSILGLSDPRKLRGNFNVIEFHQKFILECEYEYRLEQKNCVL